MKQKKTLLWMVLAFVILIGGASVLYGKLGKAQATEQLAVISEEQSPAVEEQTGSEKQQETPEVQPEKDGLAESPEEQKESEKPSETEESSEAEHMKAPDFTVYNEEGEEVHLSDYLGKPVVLNFWASWCGPCQMEMPDFHEKYLESGEEIQFLMINMTDGSRETKETAAGFIEKKQYEFPVFFDTEFDAAMAFGAYSLPTTFFLDKEGYVIAHATGAIDGATLQKGMDLITP